MPQFDNAAALNCSHFDYCHARADGPREYVLQRFRQVLLERSAATSCGVQRDHCKPVRSEHSDRAPFARRSFDCLVTIWDTCDRQQQPTMEPGFTREL
jgi:hypothetical protein